MPSVTIHLPDDVKEDVEKYADEIKKSFSAACRKLIEIGYKVEQSMKKQTADEEQKSNELRDKHTLYLLQNLNISKEILRCVFNKDRVRSGGNTAEDNLSTIRDGTKEYIKGFLGKEE